MLYLCAGPSLYPLRAITADFQNGYWRSNLLRIGFECDCPQKESVQVLESLCPLDNGAAAPAGATGNRPHVEVNIRVGWETSDRYKAGICALDYLAALRRRRSLARLEHQSVGSDDDSIGRTSSHNEGSVTNGGMNKEKQDQPLYMRRNDTGIVTFERTETGQIIDDIGDADIDVSYDKKTWFHLLGPKCLTKSKHLQIIPLEVPESTKRDPLNPLPSRE